MFKSTFRWIIGSVPLLGLAFATATFAKDAAKEVVKEPTDKAAQSSPLQFKVKDIQGKDVDLADYKGKVVLIVNVASKCGNTPQYEAMEKMYEKYKDQGFVILGFPANNFGSQEPGSNEQIKQFCEKTYHVAFPMMAKISVKGEDKAPLYKYLTTAETAGDFAGEVEWNFTKFLVDRNGALIARIGNRTKPDAPGVVAAIEKALAAKAAK
jgi:glutathione peroxidase